MFGMQRTGRYNYTKLLFEPWQKKYPDDKRSIEQIMELLETDIDLAIKVSMVYWEAKKINNYINLHQRLTIVMMIFERLVF